MTTTASPAELLRQGRCPHCGHDLVDGGHYVPALTGDAAGFACDRLCTACRIEDDRAIRKHMARVHSWTWRMLHTKSYEELMERDRQLHCRQPDSDA